MSPVPRSDWPCTIFRILSRCFACTAFKPLHFHLHNTFAFCLLSRIVCEQKFTKVLTYVIRKVSWSNKLTGSNLQLLCFILAFWATYLDSYTQAGLRYQKGLKLSLANRVELHFRKLLHSCFLFLLAFILYLWEICSQLWVGYDGHCFLQVQINLPLWTPMLLSVESS